MESAALANLKSLQDHVPRPLPPVLLQLYMPGLNKSIILPLSIGQPPVLT